MVVIQGPSIERAERSLRGRDDENVALMRPMTWPSALPASVAWLGLQLMMPAGTHAQDSSAGVVETERWAEPRTYSGAQAAEWENPALAWIERRPRGSPHFGLLLEGGVVVSNSTTDWETVTVAAAVGLYAFLDVTLDADQTMRIGIYGDFVQLAGANTPLDSFVTYLSGGGAIGVRLLFGVDLVEHFVFRAGVESGAVFPEGEVGGSAIGRFELAWRHLDDRNLELGVAAFGGLRYGAHAPHGDRGGTIVVPGVTFFVAWVFS